MKQSYFILSASIAAALAGAPAMLMAQPTVSAGGSDAPRITQTVSNTSLYTIPKTYLPFIAQATASTPLPGTAKLNHLQLILKPSASRQAAMETTIASLHDPKSAQFQKWLTPQEFGQEFGAAPADIAAVTAWLTAQGFTVNNVYPNKTQIDFSGTVAQVNAAFHTQENVYTLSQTTRDSTTGKLTQTQAKHLSNSSNISIPAALAPVVAGVMGLNDFHATALVKKPKVAQWNASKKGFVAKDAAPAAPKGIKQAVSFNGGALRGLVPNDMSTIYNVKTIRANGLTGAGVTIAVVEDGDMVPADWTNFVSVFNLGQFNGTFSQINPAPASGPNNCVDPSVANFGESTETVLDAEWSTAIAPGANIEVATCADYYVENSNFYYATSNFFGGVFVAATNLINEPSGRPDIISASYGYGEHFTDPASKTGIDLMWAQADAEGISVFVSAGDSGSNPSFNGGIINGESGDSAVDANAFGTSPHDTVVGGTDFADYIEGTTSQYFAPTPSAVGGSALSYVPEIPWNTSCGNGPAATAMGFSSAVAYCQEYLKYDPNGDYVTSEAGSGGPSRVDAKPAWQRQIYNAAPDQSRDVPDVSLFGGSWGDHTWVILCTSKYPCEPGFTTATALEAGTSLSSPMFAGIQALMDQGLAARGLPLDQGNAAPTLYALAAQEYGGATGTPPATLAACNANNGTSGTSGCVFYNVTSGSNSTQCFQETGFTTANCYYYGTVDYNNVQVGLTSTVAAPTSYTATNKAFPAQPGWSFANGLGSVNATNLLIAWRAFDNAPPAAPAGVTIK
jgi:subtilase family serine protease